jgi:hypothetical protein
MKKIKILFYSHTIDFAGTWRSHERTLLNLNKELFDVYVFYNPNVKNDRLDYLKTQMDNDKIIPFEASIDKFGSEQGYPYKETNFSVLAKSFNFDIVHFARSGYFEWPFIERIAPIQIESNVFGGKDNSTFLDCSVTISNRMTQLRGGSDYMVYYPIPLPYGSKDNLRESLNIPNGYHIFGRTGRGANFSPISLTSLKRFKDMGHKFKYIILGPCDTTKYYIERLYLTEDCILIEPTNDDEFIHRFHNTIDIFLHYRSDGETFGAAVAQAMMYGIPVISHYAGYNAQSEIISDGGYVAKEEDDYLNFLLKLTTDKEFYNTISSNAKKRAMDFEQSKIISEWENIYVSLYNKKTSQ